MELFGNKVSENSFINQQKAEEKMEQRTKEEA